MPKFNERLRSLRKEHGLSQKELSDQLLLLVDNPKGYSKSSINMFERGDREPGIEQLETIADYFNVDMDYLMGKSAMKNKSLELILAQQNKSPAVSDEALMIAKQYDGLNDTNRFVVRTIISNMSEDSDLLSNRNLILKAARDGAVTVQFVTKEEEDIKADSLEGLTPVESK